VLTDGQKDGKSITIYLASSLRSLGGYNKLLATGCITADHKLSNHIHQVAPWTMHTPI